MIHYTEEGKGFPIVLIHGFCETSQIWSELAPALAARYRVIAIDLPGFGRSSTLNHPFTLTAVAHRVTGFLKENLKLTTCIAFGHSLGGYVVLAMADQQPAMLEAFGLIHSTAVADSEERRISRGKVIEFVAQHGVLPFVQSFIPPLFFNPRHPAVSTVVELAAQTSAQTVMGYTEAMRNRPDRTRVLKEFKKPILLLAGKNDTIIPVQSLEEQAKLAPDASLVVLHEAAHMGMLENVSETANAIRTFLQRVRV
jgi:pimeloyl-ACP methyl ester carboxylesterase